MKTYVKGSREYLSLGKIKKPVTIKTTVYWSGHPYTYTAIPMDMLDSLRAMIKGCGFKCITYFVGDRPRPLRPWIRPHSTRKENANWAKIRVYDPKTGSAAYL